MAWWALIPAAMSAVSTISQNNQSNEQNVTQKRWNEYNAQMQYNTDINNIQSQYAISQLNAQMVMSAAAADSAMTNMLVESKVKAISATAKYNDLLYEQELTALWEELGLDIELIEKQRAKERGEIEVTQSASGTVMGQDSNADVIIDQMTQEAMDKFVTMRGADIQAARINNARAQGLWQAQQEINAVALEGNLSNAKSSSQAAIQANGIAAQSAIAANAGLKTAYNSYTSGMAGADLAFSQNQTTINNNFASGMFSSIGQGFSSYMNTRSVGSSDSLLS